jgi:hypothetical protein
VRTSVLNGAVGAAFLALTVLDSVDVVAQEPPRPSFSEWLSAVRSEALDRGIREDLVREAPTRSMSRCRSSSSVTARRQKWFCRSKPTSLVD